MQVDVDIHMNMDSAEATENDVEENYTYVNTDVEEEAVNRDCEVEEMANTENFEEEEDNTEVYEEEEADTDLDEEEEGNTDVNEVARCGNRVKFVAKIAEAVAAKFGRCFVIAKVLG